MTNDDSRPTISVTPAPAPSLTATFVRRPNRFVAEVEVDGSLQLAHVPNSGRMAELFVPGACVLLRHAASPKRKTRFDVELVEYGGRWVGVDSRRPPGLVIEAWRAGLLPELNDFERVRREVACGASRLDLLFEGPAHLPGLPSARVGEDRCWGEAKNCNLVEDGVALFPDAPTLRGRKHVEELAKAVAQGERAAVFFVVQRDDACAVAMHPADPAFADAVAASAGAGVEFYGIGCEITAASITPVKRVDVVTERA